MRKDTPYLSRPPGFGSARSHYGCGSIHADTNVDHGNFYGPIRFIYVLPPGRLSSAKSIWPPPSDGFVRKTLAPGKEDAGYKWYIHDYKSTPGSAHAIQNFPRRRSCRIAMILYWDEKSGPQKEKGQRAPHTQLFKALLLVDCCSSFCAVLRIKPRPMISSPSFY